MNPQLHNFLTTLRRQRLYSLLNILGLAIAFAVAIIITIQLSWEYNYGTTEEEHEKIFRVEADLDGRGYNPWIWPTIAEQLICDEPRVEAFFACDAGHSDALAATREDGDFIQCTTYGCNFPIGIFTFNMIEGSIEAINEPDMAIIPLSLAEKLFPAGGAIGEMIFIKYPHKVEIQDRLTIGGIYEDLPSNSGFPNSIINRGKTFGEAIFGQGLFITSLYIKTANSQENLDAILSGIQSAIDDLEDGSMYKNYLQGAPVRLLPISEIYYSDTIEISNSNFKKGSRSNSNTMLWIAILIVVIAVVNFVNLSTALATSRLRSLNTRYVFGESKAALRLSIVGEAVGFVAIAFFVSLILVILVAQSSLMELLVVDDISPLANGPIVASVGFVALLIGLASGLYPAYYSTSFTAAIALKTSNGGSRSGSRLRALLIWLQVAISIVLVIYSLFIFHQNNYIKTADQGFDKENVLVLNTGALYNNYKDLKLLKERLLENPRILMASLAYGYVGEGEGVRTSRTNKDGEREELAFIPCDADLLPLLKIPIIEGRNFVEGEKGMVVNRTMQREYEIELNEEVSGCTVVGVCEDFVTHTMRKAVAPMAFMNDFITMSIYIRVQGEALEETIEYIRQIATEINPEQVFDCELLDESLWKLYEREERYSVIISLLAILAIIITLIGVVGLIIFEMQYRHKEIALRKIHGAQVSQILTLVYRRFFYICVAAAVVAIPSAFFVVERWLSSFAFSVSVSPLLFVLGTLVVFSAVAAVVVALTIQSARSNPIESLKK
ncbi:MAG: FtsX-like permease family protein [Rikenellaceae bacterium]